MTRTDLLAEERSLKTSTVAALRTEVSRHHRVFDSRGMSKTDLVWLILEARHGRKTINSLLGF